MIFFFPLNFQANNAIEKDADVKEVEKEKDGKEIEKEKEGKEEETGAKSQEDEGSCQHCGALPSNTTLPTYTLRCGPNQSPFPFCSHGPHPATGSPQYTVPRFLGEKHAVSFKSGNALLVAICALYIAKNAYRKWYPLIPHGPLFLMLIES